MTRAPYCVANVNHACDDLIIAGTVADGVGRGLPSAGAVAKRSQALKDYPVASTKEISVTDRCGWDETTASIVIRHCGHFVDLSIFLGS